MLIKIAAIVIVIGFSFFYLGRLSFRYRAFRNKPAWNGLTGPFLIIGVILSSIGLVLMYLAY